MGRKRKFTEEFKQDAVNYYEASEKSMTSVAKELKIPISTLRDWIVKAEKNDGR